jgi:hypothetical protein
LIAKRFSKKVSLRGLVLFFLLLSLCLWFIFSTKPQATFYLLPFRAWELLAGALTYLLYTNAPKKHSNILASIGFNIVIALVINPFQILDTIGILHYPLIVFSSCLILAHAGNSGIGKVLSSKPLISIGKRSYEIYLWHFPVFSFSYHLSLTENEFTDICLLLLTGFLGFLTYEFVGIRFRSHEKVPNSKRLISWVLSYSLLLSSISFVLISTKGLPGRFEKAAYGDVGQEVFYEFITDRSVPCEPAVLYNSSLVYGELKRCRQSLPNNFPNILLLGDSTAEALFPGLVSISGSLSVGYYIETGLPLLNNPNFSTIFRHLLSNSYQGTILISSHWFGYSPLNSKQIEEFQLTIKSLLNTGKKVVVIGGVPTFEVDAEKCIYRNLFGLANPSCTLSHDDMIKHNNASDATPMQIAIASNVPYVSLNELFCSESKCQMTKGPKLFYRDNLHLNLIGSRIVGQKIINQLYAMGAAKSETNP